MSPDLTTSGVENDADRDVEDGASSSLSMFLV